MTFDRTYWHRPLGCVCVRAYAYVHLGSCSDFTHFLVARVTHYNGKISLNAHTIRIHTLFLSLSVRAHMYTVRTRHINTAEVLAFFIAFIQQQQQAIASKRVDNTPLCVSRTMPQQQTRTHTHTLINSLIPCSRYVPPSIKRCSKFGHLREAHCQYTNGKQKKVHQISSKVPCCNDSFRKCQKLT